jgi:glycosyltransferase involved in cell wall biosynthesis
MIKAQQADNKEYFIAVLEDEAEENFVTVLKAFTRFKNWQQSSMQFLILPKYEAFSNNIRQKLQKYVHRQDVRLLEDLEENQIASVLASAYAMVLMWTSQPDLVVLTAALQCCLPVISPRDNDVKEYAGNAALYLNDTSVETLGNALIRLYKDEALHAQLKEACKESSSLLSRNEYEPRLWKLLQTAAYS